MRKKKDNLRPIARELIFVFNEHKLLILKELYKCRDNVCGCDLIDKIGLTKDLLSYHIKTLRQKGYIEEKRCGRKKNYAINKKKFAMVGQILKLTKLINK